MAGTSMSLYALIATVALPVVAHAPPSPPALPAKAVAVLMCKHIYGVLITLSDGTILMFSDPDDPDYQLLMRLVKKEDFGVLEITPVGGCPVQT
jgi:hypothetical protein